MPVVPFQRGSTPLEPTQSVPKVNPIFLMAATAELHEAGRLLEVADKKSELPLAADKMDDSEYNNSWVKSIARQGRSDDQMKSLHPDLDAYRLDENSDLISYHKKPAARDLTS